MNSRAEADAAEKIGELSSVSSLLLRYSSCLISEKCNWQIKKRLNATGESEACGMRLRAAAFARYGEVWKVLHTIWRCRSEFDSYEVAADNS